MDEDIIYMSRNGYAIEEIAETLGIDEMYVADIVDKELRGEYE